MLAGYVTGLLTVLTSEGSIARQPGGDELPRAPSPSSSSSPSPPPERRYILVMGAWGTGIYDNDDAADWAHGLDGGGLDLVRAALQATRAESHLEASEGAAALAAADVIARLKSGGGEQSPYAESAMNWVDQHEDDDAWLALLPAARAAVTAIQSESSELRQLWAEDDTALADWLVVVAELEARLTDDDR